MCVLGELFLLIACHFGITLFGVVGVMGRSGHWCEIPGAD
jgi:hypothetical protein